MTSATLRRGVCLRMGATLVFCIMSGLIRCGPDIPTSKMTLFRFVVGLAVLGTAALFGRIELRFIHGPLLLLRGLTGGVAVFLFFLSIAKLGVGKGTVIVYSFPIFASLFGMLVLGESTGPRKWGAIAGAFAGIVLMTSGRPGGGSFLSFGLYEALAVLGAVLSGVAVVAVRKLHETDSTYAIFFSQCLFGLWIVLIPANMSGGSVGYGGGALLLAIALTAVVAQLLMTESYRYTSACLGSQLGMLLPVMNLVVGIVVFREPVSLRVLAGAGLVIACCVAIIAVGDGPGDNAPADA